MEDSQKYKIFLKLKIKPVSENECPQNVIRTLWNEEINQDYDLYLASLRANKDAKYLIEERNRLISQLRKEQDLNISLRKSIRALEKEMYIMCHKNAHKSCVIDGLHRVDERRKTLQFLNFEKERYLFLGKQNQYTGERMLTLLRNDISLLRSKTESDNEVIKSLKPHKNKLESILDNCKLEIHQEAEVFKRELNQKFEKFKDCHSKLDTLLSKTYEKENSIEEKDINSTLLEDDQNLEKNLHDTNSSSDENGKLIEKENNKLSEIELMSNENQVISDLILSQYHRISCKINEIIEEITVLFEIKFDQALIKDYLKRLHIVKKKQEFKIKTDDDTQTRALEEEEEELRLLLNIHMEENKVIYRILNQFSETIAEDFHINQSYTSGTKNLFLKELQDEKFITL